MLLCAQMLQFVSADAPMTVRQVIEVQHGDSFAEDDIERLDDDYGRSAQGRRQS